MIIKLSRSGPDPSGWQLSVGKLVIETCDSVKEIVVVVVIPRENVHNVPPKNQRQKGPEFQSIGELDCGYIDPAASLQGGDWLVPASSHWDFWIQLQIQSFYFWNFYFLFIVKKVLGKEGLLLKLFFTKQLRD